MIPLVVNCTVAESTQQYDMTVSERTVSVDAEVSMQIVAGITPEFDGDYAYTPRSEQIVIRCTDRKMVDDITIDPIPSNYGLITWNGAYLTVS